MQTPVPPDLVEMKETVKFGLTKKQCVIFCLGAVIGIPVFFISLKYVGSSYAALIMLAVMFPFFMLSIYQKNGLSADLLLIHYLRHKNSVKRRENENEILKEINETKRKEEIERLEEKAGKTVIFKICRFIHKIRKAACKGAGEIAKKLDRKPYESI